MSRQKATPPAADDRPASMLPLQNHDSRTDVIALHSQSLSQGEIN
jgi:hypothetical protein